MTPIEAYQTIDGKKFFSETEANKHEISVLLDTAKCRISLAYKKSIPEDRRYELIEFINENDEIEASIAEFEEVAELVTEIAKFDTLAFLKMSDEIKKTGLKTYEKDHKLAIKEGFITLPLKGVDADEIEYEGTEADLEEE